MSYSPRLSLAYLYGQQSQKHVTVNEALRRLDAVVQLSVVSSTTDAEPGSPADGDCYILTASASGASWGTMTAGRIAAYQDGTWSEITPTDGWRAYVEDTGFLLVHDGGSWAGPSGFGVNAAPDAINRLAVKSDAALLSHDDLTPGSGDARWIINKSTWGKTASVVFQNGYSGRAEFGLTGWDNFSLKVSADGANWIDALSIDRTTGDVTTRVLNSIKYAATSGYSDSAFFKVTNNGDGSNWSRVNFGQISTNVMFMEVSDQANAKGTLVLQAYGAGVLKVGNSGKLTVANGVQIGSPTGGDKGFGAINAQAVYDDNALLSCYVFDQALDGAIDPAKWDARVPDRLVPEETAADQKTGETRVVSPAREISREHLPMRKFSERIGGDHDPLTLDGYAKHWREKRHLSSMPNETKFDPEQSLAAGEWIQRLVETVEIQAVLIEQLNQGLKALQPASGSARR